MGSSTLTCLRCGGSMQQADFGTWFPGNLLIKKMQAASERAGIRLYHCGKCGKLEFFKAPGTNKNHHNEAKG